MTEIWKGHAWPLNSRYMPYQIGYGRRGKSIVKEQCHAAIPDFLEVSDIARDDRRRPIDDCETPTAATPCLSLTTLPAAPSAIINSGKRFHRAAWASSRSNRSAVPEPSRL